MQVLRSRLLKASGLILTANVLGGLMNLVSIILTIRYLSPELLGILTIAITTMQVVATMSNAGLNENLLTMLSRAEAAQRPDEVVNSLAANLQIRLIVTGVIITGGLLLAQPMANGLFRQPDLAFPLSLAFVGACGVSFQQHSLTVLQASRAYYWYVAVKLIRFTALLMALLVLAGIGKLDLTTALVVNTGAPFLAFAASLFFAPVWVLRGNGNSLKLFHQIWDFSKWVFVRNLSNMSSRWLHIYLMTVFASPAELGIYSAAVRLCGEVNVLAGPVHTVLFPEVSRRADSLKLASFERLWVGRLVILSGFIMGLGLLTSPLIPIVLGERYAASMGVFQVLLVARSALIPTTPLSMLFYVMDRTRAGALFGVMQTAVLGGIGSLLIPTYGALGAAWTQVFVIVAATIYLVIFAWPYLRGPKIAASLPSLNLE